MKKLSWLIFFFLGVLILNSCFKPCWDCIKRKGAFILTAKNTFNDSIIEQRIYFTLEEIDMNADTITRDSIWVFYAKYDSINYVKVEEKRIQLSRTDEYSLKESEIEKYRSNGYSCSCSK